MINYPVIYRRDFRHDFPQLPKVEDDGLRSKCQRAAFAMLPLLGLYRPFRAPLSIGMSCMRAATQAQCAREAADPKLGLGHAFQTGLAMVNGIGFLFAPTLAFACSSMSDFALNSLTMVQEARAGKGKEALEAFAYAATDALFVAAFLYGSIYLTVAAMAQQIALECYKSGKHFKHGNYIEGIGQAILAGAHIKLAIPQMKVLQWQIKHNPVFEAELKQNGAGFVYLDIPDEYVHSLFEHCGEVGAELPPYFGPGMAGAHVSVIMSGEMQKGMQIADIGKKFQFRIVHTDTVKPAGWQSAKSVQFLTIACPELEEVRMRANLPSRIGGDHDFHLTYAVKRK